MKINKYQYTILFVLTAILYACSPPRTIEVKSNKVSLLVLTQKVSYVDRTDIYSDVIIYPGAFISTSGEGRVIFHGKVDVIGEAQVFDESVNIELGPASMGTLNPTWFGARGNDDLDDTKAFIKTLEIAKAADHSINIMIPIGVYKIAETLQVGNSLPNKKAINLRGVSMSIDGQSGSCLQWIGPSESTMIALSNYSAGTIENIDFTAIAGHRLKHNLTFRPFDYQVVIKNCSFNGCAGPGSGNINLNKGNNLQVSEIYFENCVFKGLTEDNIVWQTESAIIGGLANTKNFSFRYCTFSGYSEAAINLEVTDILRVENCTFAFNQTDIVCLLCNTLASANYSEHSGSFFRSTVSTNISFTTLINNCFYGTSGRNYVITEGGGNLVLINNNFGGLGGEDDENKIKWQLSNVSNIYSVGNFFRNLPSFPTPYQLNDLQNKPEKITSFGDLIGTDGKNIKPIKKHD